MKQKSMLLAFILTIAFSFTGSVYAYDVQLRPFKDEQHDYARESIYALMALGIISGYPDGTFRPDESLTREAFVKLLVTAAEANVIPPTGDLPADVATDRWSAPYISVAYERGWLDELLDRSGRLLPVQTITREEVAVVMGKMLLAAESNQTRKLWLEAGWSQFADERKFSDKADIAESMQPYVYYTVHQGLMAGEPTGFKPKEPLIRKQAAAVIDRLITDQTQDRRIDFTGFYAIRSYGALDQINKLSDVIMGWSRLSYETAGTAALDTHTPVFRIPPGYEEVIAAADAADVAKQLMVFYDSGNLKAFVQDKPARQAFIDSLLKTLDDPAYGFTGVCIDFEGLKEAERAADFVSFLADLKRQLGPRTLSVAVPPVYYYIGYDLQKIGELADQVILMAYDFTHHESKLPSAPLPLVNDAVKTALTVIPNDKLTLGISKQANQWITSGGVTALPVSPAIADVENRLTMQDVAQTRSLPYFLDLITFEDERGSHEIYYESTQSIADKIRLAQFYNLQGVSLWHMGNFTATDWERIGQHAAD